MSEEVFLGVVELNGNIAIPWRGTHVFNKHGYNPGQIVLVTLDDTDSGMRSVVKVEIPTLDQLKQMKDELKEDWSRFSKIFKQASMIHKVQMLRALDREQRTRSNEQKVSPTVPQKAQKGPGQPRL